MQFACFLELFFNLEINIGNLNTVGKHFFLKELEHKNDAEYVPGGGDVM